MKEVFNTISTGIVIVDTDQKIIYANNAVEKVTGTEPSLLLNKKATDAFQGLDSNGLKDASFKGKVKLKDGSANVLCKAFKKYRILYLS